MEPIRVLYVNGGIMDRGGISSYMMNYYRNIDRNKVQIDFVVHGFNKGVYDDEILHLGGKIYNIPVKTKDYIGNIRGLRSILKSNKYKIVHSHMDAMGAIVLKEAKRAGIPIRIAHSHNTNHLTNNKVKYLINEIARKKIIKYATNLWACSEEAGVWLFGRQAFENGNIVIVKNAIEIEKYKFNILNRNKLRKEYDIENNYVIGHVGRFDYQKNHMFLLDIFYEVKKSIANAKLMLIGDGHLKNEIENKMRELNIVNEVILVGESSRVEEFMNAFDIFVLPSLFEGLGIVAIEAQANGLYCCLSDKIPSEVAVSNKVEFISINDSNEWVNKIENNKISERKVSSYIFIENGYEVSSAAEKLCSMYIKLIDSIGGS